MAVEEQQPAGSPAPEGYVPNAEMVARGQQGFTAPAPAPAAPAVATRPDHIPEKFWDAEKGVARVDEMAKSYAELEKARSAPKEEPRAPAPEPKVNADGTIEKPPEPEAPAPAPLAEAVQAAAKVFSETGELSGEARESLTKQLSDVGLPPEALEVYLAGVEALGKKSLAAIYAETDGEENFKAMAAWAAEKLTDAELEAYNEAVQNPRLQSTAVAGLYAKFQKAQAAGAASPPSEGRTIAPSGNQGAAGDTFRSRREYSQAVGDPRYGTDEAYRLDVQAKLERSKKQGFSMVDANPFGV